MSDAIGVGSGPAWQSPRARSAARAQFIDEPTVIEPRSSPRAAPLAGMSLQAASDTLIARGGAPERRLVRAAAPLLMLAAELRRDPDQADVTALRRRAEEEIDRFERAARQIGASEGDIVTARYALCAMIDESVLMTVWGGASEWSTNSLLHRFHNETWGGEKLFVLIDLIKERVDEKLPVLILLHACLMLGFEGKYRVIERGREQLDDLQAELTHLVRRHSNAFSAEPFSPPAAPAAGGARLRAAVPLWVLALATAGVLVLVHAYARVRLDDSLEPLLRMIAALQVNS